MRPKGNPRINLTISYSARTKMNVTLECGDDGLTIWFGAVAGVADIVPIDDLPQCQLLIGGAREVRGLRFGSDASKLCPYELVKFTASHSGLYVTATLQSTYDSSCDMGYVYFDKRGPGSAKRSIDCGFVVLDVGDDGAIIGIEVFSPSETMPRLASQDAK